MIKSVLLSLLLVLVLVVAFHIAKLITGNVPHALVIMTILSIILAFGTGWNVGMAEHAGFTEMVVALTAMFSAAVSCAITVWHIEAVIGICFFVIVGIASLMYAIRSLLPEIRYSR